VTQAIIPFIISNTLLYTTGDSYSFKIIIKKSIATLRCDYSCLDV